MRQAASRHPPMLGEGGKVSCEARRSPLWVWGAAVTPQVGSSSEHPAFRVRVMKEAGSSRKNY